jgi:hypothetical protein
VVEYFIGKIDANQEFCGIDVLYELASEFGEPGEGGRP